MPRRSRNRAHVAKDEPTEFGENTTESKMRKERSESISSVELRKRGNRPSAIETPKPREMTPIARLSSEASLRDGRAIEKANGGAKVPKKEPKIRAGLLRDINAALLKNKKETKTAQSGGRIQILI